MRISQSSSARLVAAVVFALLGVVPLLGQRQGAAWTTPRTPWGHPDFQGVWNAATLTPIERPDNVGGRLTLTPAEAADIERTEKQRVELRARPSNPDRNAPPVGANVGGYNNFWIDRGSGAFMIDGQYRTSIIVEPPNGKIPQMLSSAVQRNRGARGTVVRPTSDAAESVGPGRPGRLRRHRAPAARRALHPRLRIDVRTADAAELLLQQQQADRADGRLRDDPGRDGARRADHPPEGRPRPGARQEVDGRLGGPLGGRHAGRRDDQLHEQDALPRVVREHEGHRALSPHRGRTILYNFTVVDPDTWATPWTGEYPWVKSDTTSTSTPATKATTRWATSCAARGCSRPRKQR